MCVPRHVEFCRQSYAGRGCEPAGLSAPHGQHARMDHGQGIRAGLVLAMLLCFRPVEQR
jgi:hypothetical protein